MGVLNMQSKAAVSVSDMARMVGLSRARFYQLMEAATFPSPTYDPETGRPYFDEAQQLACLEVRNRNVGIDGKLVLFYAPRSRPRSPLVRPRPKTRPPATPHADLLEAVKALGLTLATSAQVEEAMTELYPQGASGLDQAEMVRAVFLRLKQMGSPPARRPVS